MGGGGLFTSYSKSLAETQLFTAIRIIIKFSLRVLVFGYIVIYIAKKQSLGLLCQLIYALPELLPIVTNPS
jgi:hypothetical protein